MKAGPWSLTIALAAVVSLTSGHAALAGTVTGDGIQALARTVSQANRDGVIRNNMTCHDARRGLGSVGIALESAPKALVQANAVFQEHDYPNAIEYRFRSTTGVRIIGNVTSRTITKRDGASARLDDNFTDARSNWFVNPRSGDLRLTGSAPAAPGMKRQ